ncbi:HAMP domain-containing protein [Ornithinibacillus sp. L9]|uniref:HAMP domain-containing protein n=2 Tax=Ornithinibacillus caprae TaxID=2678566 RepID=A0A6N8FFS7_9BACI|nr:HAMP domain-containing protein [Ornithinibacillus caprae]
MKARDTTMDAIENRLVREAELMGYIANNLKFTYVSDDDYFMQQLDINIRSQHEKLDQDGITSDYFYITNNELTPFSVSQDTIPTISEDLIHTISESKNGILHRNIEGVKYTITFREMEEIDGIYVLLVPTASYMGNVNQMAYFTIAVGLGSIVVSTIAIILFVRSFTKPITVLRETMRKVRNGELHYSKELKTSIPEITSLHKSYNAMIQYMTSILKEIKGTTANLEQTGEELQQSSRGTLESSHDVIEAIQVVKNGAEQTATSSETSVDYFKTMKDKIDSMITNMSEVFHRADEMNHSAMYGEKSMEKLITTIRTFETDFEDLTATIHQVHHSSHSISQLVGLIQGIAEQTKLLSLNASIEAARAGEAGNGFAVVANEVGKLAEQSSSAAVQITETIANMEDLTTSASDEFDKMLSKTKSTLDISDESKQSIDNLMVEIANVSSELQGMQGELKELEEILPGLEQETESFLSVSQETLASTEEMLASSESQVQQMEATHAIGKRLMKISQSLTDHTKRFQVEK